MKAKRVVGLLVGACVAGWASVVMAQEPLVRMYTETNVRVSMAPQWEEVWKERAAWVRKYRRPLYPYTTLQTEDHRYVFLTALQDLADFEKWNEAQGTVNEKARAAGEVRQARAPGAVEYTRRWWILYRPEWSYVPENPRLRDEEVNFVRWDIYYGGGGYGESRITPPEFFEELAFLYEVQQIPDGFRTYSCYRGTGPEGNCIIMERYGKDRRDFIEHARKTQELVGEEAQALFGTLLATLRKLEKIDYTVRWDLSVLEPN